MLLRELSYIHLVFPVDAREEDWFLGAADMADDTFDTVETMIARNLGSFAGSITIQTPPETPDQSKEVFEAVIDAALAALRKNESIPGALAERPIITEEPVTHSHVMPDLKIRITRRIEPA